MRFATRTFLWSFLPFAFVLLGSFWSIQKLVALTVRGSLRSSLRQTHLSKSELQNSRFLKSLGENATLKAGMQWLRYEPTSAGALVIVEDQLREMCNTLGFDLLLVSNPDGTPLAGVMRIGEQLLAMDTSCIRPPQRGFTTIEDRAYQVVSTPIDQDHDKIGVLSVGEHLDFSEFNTPTVLTRNGKVLKSSIPGIPLEEVASVLLRCKENAECEIKLRGETFISLPMQSIYSGEGYLLRSLQSVDSATRPVQAILRNVFWIAAFIALVAAMSLSLLSSRSIVRPISAVISHLRDSEKTGMLPEFHLELAPVQEIRDLMDSFNRAAAAVHEGRESLRRANVEFVESLASALDARDPYTSGHSRRVSDYSCALAKALHTPAQKVEEIRIGAMLHDIGKIGIADSVLQKAGKLTRDEIALIGRHPAIGRRILEGVNGFQEYLEAVEFHHENWNGSGYPRGLSGDEIPLAARIVHIADAYDAMTTDRPYRRGMSREEALWVIEKSAGIQFDPALVPLFTALMDASRLPATCAKVS